MSGISFMGVGSGLPVKEIIEATLAAEAAPLKRLENDKKFYESQISSMGQLKSRLSSMAEAMDKLKGLDKFQQLATKSGNDKLFTATADHAKGATAGGYNIEVLAEARSYRHVTEATSKTATFSGVLNFKDANGDALKYTPKDANGVNLPDEVIEPLNINGKTLDEIREAINSHEGLKDKVSATLVNVDGGDARLVLSSKDSGEKERFAVDLSGLGINKDTELSSDSKFYTHATNSFDAGTTFSNLGTLTFKDAAGNDLSGSIDTNGKTLTNIVAEINNDTTLNSKMSAELVTDANGKERLVINSKVAGEAGRFTANFSDPSITKDTNLSSDSSSLDAPHLDAHIKIDGIEAFSPTNNFENVISGVSVNVTAGATNETNKAANLQVKRDDKAIKDNIEAFAKAYNDVIIHLNEAKKGSLYGDSTIRAIEGEMRDILYTPTQGSDGEDTSKNFLALIGLNVHVDKTYDPKNPSSRNGTLEVNPKDLTKALNENFDRVAHILGSTSKDGGPSGYAERFTDLANRLGEPTKGLIQTRTKGLNEEVKRINTRVESTNRRLELLEERLVKQFSAIEGIIANFNSTGSFISQQMASLPGYTRNK